MARWEPAAAVYEVADLFRATCLTTGASLLWPDERVWTVETIDALLEAFIGRPDEGKESFFEKWRKQLADQPLAVHRVAADVLALYFLFPASDQVGPQAKLGAVRQVIDWKLAGEEPPNLPTVERAFATGVGHAGIYYLTGRPWQIAYDLRFARRIRVEGIDPTNAVDCERVADEALQEDKSASSSRHALLHLLFPDRFERIVSNDHKKRIIAAFAADASGIADPDDALLAIRRAIEGRTGRPGFDFYAEPDLFAVWNPGTKPVEDPEIAVLRALMEQTYPEPAIRRACLGVLGDSIELAHGVSPASWSLNPREGQDNLRLNVGRSQVCVLGADNLYLVLDGDQLDSEALARLEAEASEGHRSGAAYPSTPFAYGVHLPADKLDRLLPLAIAAHQSLIERAAALAPRTPFQQGHRPSAVEYLRRELGRELPDPVYGPAHPLDGGERIAEARGIFLTGGNSSSSPGQLASVAHMPEAELREILDLLRDKRQIVLEGPPGSGKTFLADLLARHLTGVPLQGDTDERVEIVQFHQSYGYEDFVQGIRPVTRDGALHYDVVPGIFARLCKRAAERPDDVFALVVDEINRGNVSRIFGELLMLLEYRDKRVRLPYATADGPDAYLAIPPNLFLIGTMNSTDRSLAMIDYALRRRFYFYRLLPMRDGRAPVFETWLERQELDDGNGDQILSLFIALNRRIEERLSPDFQIGHSYFMRDDIHTDDGLRRVWQHAVMPLLEEYFHGARDRREALAEFTPERLVLDPAGPAALLSVDA